MTCPCFRHAVASGTSEVGKVTNFAKYIFWERVSIDFQKSCVSVVNEMSAFEWHTSLVMTMKFGLHSKIQLECTTSFTRRVTGKTGEISFAHFALNG